MRRLGVVFECAEVEVKRIGIGWKASRFGIEGKIFKQFYLVKYTIASLASEPIKVTLNILGITSLINLLEFLLKDTPVSSWGFWNWHL